jgi:glycosyltransferase involved in cell wall biosynthesis
MRRHGEALRHFLFSPTPFAVWVLRRVSRLHGAPTVQTFCSTPPPDRPLRPLVFADRVIALCAHTAARLRAEGVEAWRLVTIPPALVPVAPADGALRARVRARLGAPPDAPMVVYLGDWDAAGAALTVAAALPHLAGTVGAHVVFACRAKGRGHAAVAAAVRDRVASLGPAARRVHLAGHLPWARDLARAADVAVFPAARLPGKMDLPLALLQSLGAGVPGVVADTGPLHDLVAAGAALGVPAGDGPGLASRTAALLADPEARRSAGARARAWAAGVTDPERVSARHEALYTELLGGQGETWKR